MWEATYYAYTGDEQVDVLTITQTGKNFSATYRGYEAEDHGPWYYFVSVQKLVIVQGGTISFTVGPRNLYDRLPTSVDKMSDLSGGTRPGTGRVGTSFRFIGSIWSDGALHLECSYESETCPFVETLVFRKRGS